jgi:WD40 repeat protein
MVSFSADGTHLAAVSNDGNVRIWDPTTCALLARFTHDPDRLNSAIYSAGQPVLGTASSDGRVYLWIDRGVDGDVQYEEVRQLQLSTGTVWATAFSPDSEYVATANDDGSVQIVFRMTGRTVAFLRPTSSRKSPRVRTLAFSPDGQLLATAGEDQQIHIWDVSRIADRDIEDGTGADRPIRTLTGHTDWVITVAFGPNNDTLASGGKDGQLNLWDIATGARTPLLNNERGQLWTVAFDPTGTLLASGGDREVIDIWNAATGEHIRDLPGHGRRIMSMTFNPAGTLLASSSADGTVRLWRVTDNVLTHAATLLGLPKGWAAYTPAGAYKTGGEVDGQFWHITKMVRFEPGELDEYLPDLAQLPRHTPLLTD